MSFFTVGKEKKPIGRKKLMKKKKSELTRQNLGFTP